MAMSVLMQKVHDLAAAVDQRLRADSDYFTGMVLVEHGDGSKFQFEYASAFRVTRPDYLYDLDKEALRLWKLMEDNPGLDNRDTVVPTISKEDIGWLIVFTEHNSFHVFSCDDLNSYKQYKQVSNIEEFPILIEN